MDKLGWGLRNKSGAGFMGAACCVYKSLHFVLKATGTLLNRKSEILNSNSGLSGLSFSSSWGGEA